MISVTKNTKCFHFISIQCNGKSPVRQNKQTSHLWYSLRESHLKYNLKVREPLWKILHRVFHTRSFGSQKNYKRQNLNHSVVLRCVSNNDRRRKFQSILDLWQYFSLEPQAWSSWGKGERFSFSLLIESNTMLWICVLGQSVGFQGFSFLPIPEFVFWWFHYL